MQSYLYKSKQRESGVELLRILLLFGVIMIHYYEAAHKCINSGINFEFLYWFRNLSASAVNTFIIISGFFMIKTYTRKPSKAITLVLQVMIIAEIEYFVDVMLGVYPLNLRHILSALVPRSYYTTLFVVLFFISPYVNKVMNELKKKGLRILLIISISIFSVYSTITKVYSEVVHLDWFGINPVGAWGSQQGFNIVNFILLYMIGAYIRVTGMAEKTTKSKALMLFGVSTFVLIIWSYIDRGFPVFGQISAWCYDNPVVILQGVSLFLFFYNIKFCSKTVNRAATAVYSTFILHYYYLNNYAQVYEFCQSSVTFMILHYLGFCTIAFLVGWIFYEIYTMLIKKLFAKIDNKFVIEYFA